jgi:trk system potassium uptake protein
MLPPPRQYTFELNDKILLFGTLGNLRKITKYL